MSETNATQHVGEFANPLHPSASDEVLRLTWAVIDGVASQDERRRLGELVTNEYRVRNEYVKAVRLDRDLADVLNPINSPRITPSCPGHHPRTFTLPVYAAVPPALNLAATG